MSLRGERIQHGAESATDVLNTWASLFTPVSVSWNPLADMIRAAEADADKFECRLQQLVDESDARLGRVSLCEPLLAQVGLNRWLGKEREEAYSDWLAWILEQLQQAKGGPADVLKLLDITSPGIVQSAQLRPFKIEREHCIRGGRLDLLLTIDDSVMIVIEVKKYSAESSDTAKQAGYFDWMNKGFFRERKAFLLITDAEEENYENFSALRWDELCIRLRRLLPRLSSEIGLVRTAMFVAFVSAVETNLLNFVAPRSKDIERFFYARTIEYLEKSFEGYTA